MTHEKIVKWALEIRDPAVRREFIENQCGADAALRQQVVDAIANLQTEVLSIRDTPAERGDTTESRASPGKR